MLILLAFIGFLPLTIAVIIGIKSSIKNHRFYRSFYRTLPFKKFYIYNDHIFSHHFREKDDGFVWFLEDNSFCLSKHRYLYYTGTDPVKRYWKRKFQKWFKENVNIHFLPEYHATANYSSKMKGEHGFPSPHTYDAYLRRYYAGILLPALAVKGQIHSVEIGI